MRLLRNNEGIALVTALMFTLISLGIIMMLMYSIIQGTKVSKASKIYHTALEASYGTVELLSRDVLPSLLRGELTSAEVKTKFTDLSMDIPKSACFEQKLAHSTGFWSSDACSADDKTFVTKTSPDITFNLSGYTVYSKIVDTRCGGADGQPCSNSDSSGIDYLDAGGGVTTSTGTVTPQHRPAYYRIEVQGERTSNPIEKAKLSVLYAY